VTFAEPYCYYAYTISTCCNSVWMYAVSAICYAVKLDAIVVRPHFTWIPAVNLVWVSNIVFLLPYLVHLSGFLWKQFCLLPYVYF